MQVKQYLPSGIGSGLVALYVCSRLNSKLRLPDVFQTIALHPLFLNTSSS